MIEISNNIYNKLNSSALGVLSCAIKIEISRPDFWNFIQEDINTVKNKTLGYISTLNSIHNARKIYKNCGADPLRYRLAADSLIRRIIKGNELYRVNNAIDILNYISFTTGISIGGYDMQKIQGNIILDIGEKNELYEGIGRGQLNIHNIPLLRDSTSAFGTPTSDSLRTMVTDGTQQFMMVFFFIEGQTEFTEITKKTTDLLIKYCGANRIHTELQPKTI